MIAFAAPLLAQPPAVDLLVVLDASPEMPWTSLAQDIRRLQPEDRVAVMKFSSRTRLVQPFTNDRSKIESALGHSRVPRLSAPGSFRSQKPANAVEFAALLEAARMFPSDAGRQRAILLVFATDDHSAAPLDELKQALSASQIRLYAVAVRPADPTHALDSRIETPPTIPGRTPPVRTDRGELPLTTLKTVTELVALTGGRASADESDLPGLIGGVRSGADQPQKLRLVSREDAVQLGMAESPSH